SVCSYKAFEIIPKKQLNEKERLRSEVPRASMMGKANFWSLCEGRQENPDNKINKNLQYQQWQHMTRVSSSNKNELLPRRPCLGTYRTQQMLLLWRNQAQLGYSLQPPLPLSLVKSSLFHPSQDAAWGAQLCPPRSSIHLSIKARDENLE
ncbi:mCG145631, partial [Mus musculus]